MPSKTEEILHVAICQAVAILNVAPELARITEGRQVRDILRVALANYANAVMDEPAQSGEVEHMKRLHRKGTRGVKTVAEAHEFTAQSRGPNDQQEHTLRFKSVAALLDARDALLAIGFVYDAAAGVNTPDGSKA